MVKLGSFSHMDVLESYFLLCLVELYCFLVSCHEHFSILTRQADSSIPVCGSTPGNLRNAFLSNCTRLNLSESTCTHAWDGFSRAFAHKEPNKVKYGDYVDYFNLLPIEVPPNQNLFWSGVIDLVAVISCRCPTGADVVSSANTPSSAIIDNIGLINWCGTSNVTSKDGIDYSNGCPCGVTEAFWAQFSIQFASVASGTVFYLGNGEREGGVFRPDSNFAQYELPQLSPPRVSGVVVMVIHRKEKGESCGSGQTLVHLRRRVTEQKLKYNCYDVFGDPMNQSQWKGLSSCASRIITSEQHGTTPELNECFLAEKEGTAVPIGSIVGGVLGGIGALAAVIIVLLIFLLLLRHKCPIKRFLLNNRISNKGFVSTVTYSKLSDEIDSE